MKKISMILLTIALVFGLTACGGGSDNTENNNKEPKQQEITEQKETSVLCDITKFANITSSELIELLGEPDYVEETTSTTGFVEIPRVYYDYNNTEELGEVTFVLINDMVTQLHTYKEFPYVEEEKDLLASFNIELSDDCAVAVENDITLRLRCPSEEVDNFYITDIDKEKGTFGFLKITYDMEYYEEWYLPLTSTEEIEYKSDAETLVKSMLVSPKTADFPWYDWQYGKNLFYILVSSYVDSENAFGVEIRNTFTFVYSRITKEPVLVIINDNVEYMEGYVPTADLIKELVTTTSPTNVGKKEEVKTPDTTQNNQGQTSSTQTQTTGKFITKDLNQFLAHYILPQYVTVQGTLHDYVEYDSNESTDWCYKLVGKIGNDSYEAMVYPFCDYNNNVEDLWFRYLYWNGNLIIENDPSEQIDYTPKKYW